MNPQADPRMETTELIKKVRAIEIRTRGLSNKIFSGEYHSAFKGRGMAFSENREYQHGDEIRTIDWNVTARMGHPYVKVFEEERELTVIILVDLSASANYGTRAQLKRQLITEITAVLAFSAIQNNDKIGVLFFTDRIERFIPPKKGKSHILQIIRELLEFKPQGNKTNIKGALEYLNTAIKKKAICFVLSDFMDSGFERTLRMTNRKHDVVAIRTVDQGEQELPNVGWLLVKDSETNDILRINTSSAKTKKALRDEANLRNITLRETFTKAGVDAITLHTDKPYVQPLMNLFKQRGS
ncbi:MAG: hypothetical protein RL226_719 [Bacteroidota bacterium]|jgi:uncharacterized protein (DUF58 family)